VPLSTIKLAPLRGMISRIYTRSNQVEPSKATPVDNVLRTIHSGLLKAKENVAAGPHGRTDQPVRSKCCCEKLILSHCLFPQSRVTDLQCMFARQQQPDRRGGNPESKLNGWILRLSHGLTRRARPRLTGRPPALSTLKPSSDSAAPAITSIAPARSRAPSRSLCRRSPGPRTSPIPLPW
jgi:hypothetical protein